MLRQELYAEYEKIIAGKKKYFPGTFFSGNEETNKESAILIMRYAFEKMLKWSPIDIKCAASMNILRFMKIHTLLKYLKIPEEFGSRFNSEYFAHVLYPEVIYYNEGGIILDVYKSVLSRVIHGYPKKFFHNEKGTIRAKACLSYILREKLLFASIEEVYAFFITREGTTAIGTYHLADAFALFETPIDFVHETLADSQKDEFLFHYFKFRYLYRKEKAAH